jgi:hypothetical protein
MNWPARAGENNFRCSGIIIFDVGFPDFGNEVAGEGWEGF